MTIGTRIAAARRAAGLSQEGLAAQVGVSRQAVAKWEADASLPGADNLQELARALHTSCDELLTGVPAVPGKEEELAPLLKSMQALLESQEAGRRAARRRTRRAVLLGCIAAFALLAVYANSLSAMQHRVDELNRRIAEIDGSIDSQIFSLRQNIEESLRQQASIVASYDYRLDAASTQGQALLWVTATPKESAEGLTASFTLTPGEGDPVTVEGIPAGGGSFNATLPIPLKNEYNSFAVVVSFVQGDTVRREELFWEYDFVQRFMPMVALHNKTSINTGIASPDGTQMLELKGGFGLIVESGNLESGGWPVSCFVALLQGDTVVWSLDEDMSDFNPQDHGDGTASAATGASWEEELPALTLNVKPGEAVRLRAVVTTSNGLTSEAERLLWPAD